MFGEKNVPGVTAIHHPLGQIKTGAGKIRTIIHVDHTADWPAVNSHAQLKARVVLECTADLHRASRRRFRTGVKDQRHTIAGRDFKQTARGFGSLKLLGRANNLV